MRLYVIYEAFHGSIQCQAIYRNNNGKNDQDRHHDFADLLYSFFNTEQYDDRSQCHEQEEPAQRLESAADEVGEVGISG